MTKLEITNAITNYLSKYPITLIDLLGKSIRIDSYEKYIQELTLSRNTFKDSIPEFYDSANSFLEKMNNFIVSCKEQSNLENYITSYFKSKICGSSSNSSFSPKLISPNNLSNSPETSDYALKQIYQELGYEHLTYYIQLIKNPSQLSSYLTDSKKQQVAVHYILFITNHHSPTRLSRNMTAQSLYNLTSSSINDSIKEITIEKNEYINFMNQEKDNYSTWFKNSSEKLTQLHDTSKQEYDSFLNDCNDKFNLLEKTYSNKLKVEEPSNYMKAKSEEYKGNATKWSIATVVLSVALIILLGFILDPHIEVNEKLFSIHLFSGDMPVYSSIIILAIIALIIYIIKLFIKLTISSKHLSEEYYQKHILTYFYLSLVKDGNITQEQADIILATLFTKADTGLIKNDTSSDIESIYKLMLSSK